jgi:hypothetical protein
MGLAIEIFSWSIDKRIISAMLMGNSSLTASLSAAYRTQYTQGHTPLIDGFELSQVA